MSHFSVISPLKRRLKYQTCFTLELIFKLSYMSVQKKKKSVCVCESSRLNESFAAISVQRGQWGPPKQED